VAAAELDGYRRAYGLDHDRPAKHGVRGVARDGRAGAPANLPAAERPGGTGEQPGRRGRDQRAYRLGDRPRWPTVAADRGHRAEAGRLLGAEPRRDRPGRRRDWQVARAALERLADHHRHRDDRHRPQERASGLRGRDLGRQERDGR
jgi:hypothetical protein